MFWERNMSSDYKKNKKKTVLVRKKLGGRSRKSGDLVQKVKKVCMRWEGRMDWCLNKHSSLLSAVVEMAGDEGEQRFHEQKLPSDQTCSDDNALKSLFKLQQGRCKIPWNRWGQWSLTQGWVSEWLARVCHIHTGKEMHRLLWARSPSLAEKYPLVCWLFSYEYEHVH